jgi:class 3 adenylate cyclase/tetratricopeptide (TPR) repeat protein
LGSTRTIALLFTDLVGSTELASAIGRARSDHVRREHFSDLRDAIELAGGDEVKTLGDGLMAVFPSAGAALACAVAIQQGVEWRNRLGGPVLAVRVGAAVGDATNEGGDWYGPPVVEAARLCATAKGGEILISDALRLLARSAEPPELTRVGPVELKGLPEPVVTWRVVWETAGEGGPPLPTALSAPPAAGFVGRLPELQRLTNLWNRAQRGEPWTVLLAGEPGIGKTRLAARLADDVHTQGAVVLYGRTSEDLGLPYDPWRQALQHLVETAGPGVLRRHVERHGGELTHLVPSLRARVEGVPDPQATDAEAGRYLLFGAVVGLLGEVAERCPVLLILDDLHWATQPTLTLLKHVQLTLRSARLLVMGSYREPSEPLSDPLVALLGDLQREPRVERISLAGLNGAEVLEMIELAAGHKLDLEAAAVAEELTLETDGNPFFVTELVRSLTESGAIHRGPDGRWTVPGGLRSAGLPRSVNEVIRGRVVRLGRDAARVLTTAAAIGRDFDPALLARVEQLGGGDLLDVLDAASAAALVAEQPDQSGGYSFVHALIPRALEHGLPTARRAQLHERIAEALEREPAPSAADLARHWGAASGARAQAKALHYVCDAGRAALEQLAPGEALDWFQRAIELSTAVPVDRGQYREMLIGLGEAQLQVGRPEFRETLLQAARSAEAEGDGERLVRAGLANSRGYFSSTGFVDEERVAVLEAALEHAPPDDPCRARLLALLAAELLWSPDHLRRRSLSDEAVALARERGDQAALAHVLTMSVTAVWWPETLSERLATTAELVPLTEAVGDPSQRFWAAVWRAVTAVQTGDLEEADRQLDRQRNIARRLQQPRLAFVVETQNAWRAQLAGRLDEAERLAEQARTLGEQAGEPDALSLYVGQFGPIRWHQGRLGEETDLLCGVADAVPAVSVFTAMAALAELEAGQPRHAAERLRRRTGDDFASLPCDPVQLGSLLIWAEVASRLEDRRAASLLLHRIAPLREQVALDSLGVLGVASRCAGLLAATLGRWDEADDHFAFALEQHERLGASSLAARTQLEWGLALAGRGDRESAPRAGELLTAAVAVAGELRLPGVRDRAHAALSGSGALV